MLKWRIWYYDGSKFDNTMPGLPPGRGAVLVRENRSDGQSMIVSGEYHSSKSHFAQIDNEWKATDSESVLDLLCNECVSLGFVVKGRWVRGEQLSRIHRLAENDPGFPRDFVNGEG